LELLSDPPEPEPYSYFSDGRHSTPQSHAVDPTNSHSENDSDDDGSDSASKSSSGTSSSSSSAESSAAGARRIAASANALAAATLFNKGDSTAGGQSDLKELLAEASMSDSDDETQNADRSSQRKVSFTPGANEDKHAAKRRLRQLASKSSAPAGNIAVLAVACWWLRLPVINQDFIR